MVLVVDPSQEQYIRTHIEQHGIPCKTIGYVQKGSQIVKTEGSLPMVGKNGLYIVFLCSL